MNIYTPIGVTICAIESETTLEIEMLVDGEDSRWWIDGKKSSTAKREKQEVLNFLLKHDLGFFFFFPPYSFVLFGLKGKESEWKDCQRKESEG